MNISQLQNDVIRQLLAIEDAATLSMLKEILTSQIESKPYKLSDFEKVLVSESVEDYNAGRILDHESVFERNKKWLEE